MQTLTYASVAALEAAFVALTSAQRKTLTALPAVGGGFTVTVSDDTIAAALSAGPTATVLALKIVAAAQAASGSITKQIAATETHLTGYASAANMAQVAGGAPTDAVAQPAFTALLAAVNGAPGLATPLVAGDLATLVRKMDAASVQNLAILLTLENAAAAAKTPADLATALTAFETNLAAFVTSLNTAGLTTTITAPAAITIPGVNA